MKIFKISFVPGSPFWIAKRSIVVICEPAFKDDSFTVINRLIFGFFLTFSSYIFIMF